MRWEYLVWTNDSALRNEHRFTRKGDAMRCVRDLLALGKVVTVSQTRVYYRREN